MATTPTKQLHRKVD